MTAAATISKLEMSEALSRGLEALGVAANAGQRQRLAAFMTLLTHWNRAVNLVSRRDVHRLLDRHVLDAASVLGFLHGTAIADAGSGGGLPGIPLAVLAPERRFMLIERSERRCLFLRAALRELDLANAEVRCADVRDVDARFDCVTARALAPPPAALAMLAPRIRPGGRIVLQCGEQGGQAPLPAGFSLLHDRAAPRSGQERGHRLLVLVREPRDQGATTE